MKTLFSSSSLVVTLTEVSRVSTGVRLPGQRLDKELLKVNMNHLAPGALQTDEGNFNNHAKGTLHMAICTCFLPNAM